MNHKIHSHTLNLLALQAGSRNRIRVPVAGVRNTKNIKPGDKVQASYDHAGNLVITKVKRVNRKRKNYTHTVEKDGAIRLTAGYWGLKNSNQIIACDAMSGVIVFP